MRRCWMVVVGMGLAMVSLGWPLSVFAHPTAYHAAQTSLQADGDRIRQHTEVPAVAVSLPAGVELSSYFQALLSSGLVLSYEGRSCSFKLTQAKVTEDGWYAIDGRFECGVTVAKLEELRVHNGLFLGRKEAENHFVELKLPGGDWQLVFGPGRQDYPQTVAAVPFAPLAVASSPPLPQVLGQFGLSGIEHILTGYDHLLRRI